MNNQTSNKPDDNNVETRVGRLEGAVESLSHDIQQIGDSVKDIGSGLSTFKEEVLKGMGNAKIPNWPLIASFGTIGLTIVCLAGTLVGVVMNGHAHAIHDNKQDLNMLRGQAYEQRFIDGQLSNWKGEVERLSRSIEEGQHWRLQHEQKP